MDMPKYFQEKNPLNSIFMPSIGKYMIHLPFITICNAIQMLFFSSEFNSIWWKNCNLFLKFILQIDWLNTYHKKVQDTIGPLLINTNREAYDWMELRTRKITYAVSAAPKEILSLLIILLSFTLVFVS